MKKLTLLSVVWSALPAILVVLIAVSLIGGSTADGPFHPFATPEIAEKYMEISSELGVPWDIIMLADSMAAQEAGREGIEDVNPLITSLQFCVLKEDRYKWVNSTSTSGNGEETEEPEPGPAPGEEGATDTESTGEWVLESTKEYPGLKEILTYMQRDDILNLDVSQFVTLINKIASEKGGNNEKFEVTVILNTDFEKVLKEYLEISEENIEQVMELHNSRYLELLYAGGEDINVNIPLPDLVEGDVTRQELAAVAASLINHPYQLGGKYPRKGAPDCAIDCSGFVDWVYIQCFGHGVSGGKLPPGVGMSGTALQFYACQEISEAELQVGDLGFLYDPAKLTSSYNHVGIYIGKIDGRDAFIHCAGKAYGYADRPSGRVGISINQHGTLNSKNNITGGTFSPPMKGIQFNFFRRPNFKFKGD